MGLTRRTAIKCVARTAHEHSECKTPGRLGGIRRVGGVRQRAHADEPADPGGALQFLIPWQANGCAYASGFVAASASSRR